MDRLARRCLGALLAISPLAGCMGNGGTWCQGTSDEVDVVLHPEVSDDALRQAFFAAGWEETGGYDLGERGLMFGKKVWDAETGQQAFGLWAWSTLLPEANGTSDDWLRVRLGLGSTESTTPEDPRQPTEIETVEADLLRDLRALAGWDEHPGNQAMRVRWEECIHAD